MGASHVIASGEEDLPAAVSKYTDGSGVELIFDPVAGSFVETLARCAAPRCQIIEYGWLSGELTPFPLFLAFQKGLTIRAYTLYEFVHDPVLRRAAEEFVTDYLAQGKLRPRIDRTFSLFQVVEAHRYLESNQQIGKIVLTLGQSRTPADPEPFVAKQEPEEQVAVVDFATMSDLQHEMTLLAMMRSLYKEDEAASPVDQSRFGLNIEFLVAHPSHGRIVLFTEDGSICGYALLIPYWSNEFGGTLLYIDELFVMPAARGRGVGKRFFRYLDDTRQFGAVALALEVNPNNTRALRLYRSLGFRPRQNTTLTLPLSQ